MSLSNLLNDNNYKLKCEELDVTGAITSDDIECSTLGVTGTATINDVECNTLGCTGTITSDTILVDRLTFSDIRTVSAVLFYTDGSLILQPASVEFNLTVYNIDNFIIIFCPPVFGNIVFPDNSLVIADPTSTTGNTFLLTGYDTLYEVSVPYLCNEVGVRTNSVLNLSSGLQSPIDLFKFDNTNFSGNVSLFSFNIIAQLS